MTDTVYTILGRVRDAEGIMPEQIHAVAVVHHHAMTARGAVVLWQEGADFFAEFFNTEGSALFGYFQDKAPRTMEDANERFRAECGRFWVGVPEDERPERVLSCGCKATADYTMKDERTLCVRCGEEVEL